MRTILRHFAQDLDFGVEAVKLRTILRHFAPDLDFGVEAVKVWTILRHFASRKGPDTIRSLSAGGEIKVFHLLFLKKYKLNLYSFLG